MGQDTAAREKELADRRAAVEKETGSQIGALITEKKFATGAGEAAGPGGHPRKGIDRPAHGAVRSAARPVPAAGRRGDQDQPGRSAPPPAFSQLKAFAAQYPDDLSLQLAIARIETRMPPDHDRLAAQLKIFRQFSAQNRDAAADADFQAMEGQVRQRAEAARPARGRTGRREERPGGRPERDRPARGAEGGPGKAAGRKARMPTPRPATVNFFRARW